MTDLEYEVAIRTSGKYIILVDNVVTGRTQEIQRVFDTPEEAHEYASGRVKHTKTNRIQIYETTGKPRSVIGTYYTIRDDIKPYQQHHIGLNW